ncbi:MAG: Co2+/Mg2+ efflux protein ApaG [Pseudomonadota bacterium]
MNIEDKYSIDIAAETQYIDAQSKPEDSEYVFAYRITITNSGSLTATLKTRHWIITDAGGEVQEVKGEGVVGQQPRLVPGDSFTYTSAAMIKTPVGTMHGSYQMIAADGTAFDAPIAPFRLSIPSAIH